jgi:hypothetical protein
MLTPGSQVLPGAVLVGSGGRGCEGLRLMVRRAVPSRPPPYTAYRDTLGTLTNPKQLGRGSPRKPQHVRA